MIYKISMLCETVSDFQDYTVYVLLLTLQCEEEEGHLQRCSGNTNRHYIFKGCGNSEVYKHLLNAL